METGLSGNHGLVLFPVAWGEGPAGQEWPWTLPGGALSGGLPSSQDAMKRGKGWGGGQGGKQHPWERGPTEVNPLQVQEALSDLGKKESSSLCPILAVGLCAGGNA